MESAMRPCHLIAATPLMAALAASLAAAEPANDPREMHLSPEAADRVDALRRHGTRYAAAIEAILAQAERPHWTGEACPEAQTGPPAPSS